MPMARAGASSDPLEKILQHAVRFVLALVHAKAVSIYLIDSSSKHIVVCASSEGALNGFPVPLGEGIAGTVAELGKSFRSTDADDDESMEKQFLGGERVAMGTVQSLMRGCHKTVLCVPVFGTHQHGLPTAVIQALDQEGGGNFDEFDEEGLVMLASELALVFKSKVVEVRKFQLSVASKHAVDSSDPTARLDFLREYGIGTAAGEHAPRKPDRSLDMSARSHKGLSTSSLLSSSSSSAAVAAAAAAAALPPPLTGDEADTMLSNHSTDPFALDERQMVYLAIRMLETYGLLEQYKVDAQTLGVFLHAACSKYHNTNAFHNVKHGWGTLHLSYRILRSGGDEKLLPVEIYALLIGAICHDLDHPGNNNGFEVAARTERAQIYADDTVLERHHTACALQLLDEHEYEILGCMSADEVDVFRKTMITCIMATDMAQHFQEVEYLHEWSACAADPFDKHTERAKLAGVILHCADIGAQTQKNELAIKWSDAVLTEFRSQAQREKILGITLTPFMQGLDDELACNHLQQGFIGNIVLPLWSALAACFPKLDFAAAQAHENMQVLKAKAVGLKAIHGWRRRQSLKQLSMQNLPT